MVATQQTTTLPEHYNVLAPDGSEIRFLTTVDGASMVHCRLPAGSVTQAVTHHTVEEVWYVLAGEGQLWRKDATGEQITDLSSGIAVNIPLGTHFQFRAIGADALDILITTTPPWPGADEARPVANHWTPTIPTG